MPGTGLLEYNISSKPYQVTMLTPTGNAVPLREQTLTYTSFQRPATITENGYTAAFTYNAAGDRVKMALTLNGTATLTRYYISGQYEADTETATERLYLGGDAYSAPVVYVKEAGLWKIYYICRDYLGSITHIANADGSLKQELSYDAWGRLRNPDTQVAYAPGTEPVLFLGRGYTGHEHLTWFGLINMNARLYDPALGRFLSPDPYVQAPDFTQNFNRYSYCLNNPLIYVDKDGEFWNLIIGGLIGGIANLISNWDNIKGNFWKGLGYFGIGAGVGVLSAAGGAWLAGVTKAVGFGAGALIGAGTGAFTGGATSILLNGGNNLLNNGSFFDNWKSNLVSGVIGGTISGAIGGGIRGYKYAKELGANPWTGEKYINEKSYNATFMKEGLPISNDTEKYCTARALEYADEGHQGRSASYFMSEIDKISTDGGADPEILAKKVGMSVDLAGKLNSAEQIDMIGEKLSQGKEIIVVSSKHSVNLRGLLVGDKLNLFGGGYTRTVIDSHIWDSLKGAVYGGPRYFEKIVVLNSFIK